VLKLESAYEEKGKGKKKRRERRERMKTAIFA
jgi:hypothetical protein